MTAPPLLSPNDASAACTSSSRYRGHMMQRLADVCCWLQAALLRHVPVPQRLRSAAS